MYSIISIKEKNKLATQQARRSSESDPDTLSLSLQNIDGFEDEDIIESLISKKTVTPRTV